MRSCLGIILFTFVVFPLGIAALCLLAVNDWLFDRDFYADAFDNVALYDAVLADLPDYLEVDAFEREFADLTQQQEAERALALAFREVVTPEYLRDQTLSIIDDVFTFFEDLNTPLVIDIDLAPVKATLLDPERNGAFVRALAGNLPVCQTGQEPRGVGDALPSCRPESLDIEQAAEIIRNSLPGYVEGMPDQLVLNDPIDSTVDASGLENFNLRRSFTAIIGIVLLFAFVFWVITGLIAGRGVRGNLLWLGAMLLIPAGILLLTGGFLQSATHEEVERAFLSGDMTINNRPATPEVRAALAETTSEAFGHIAGGLTRVGAYGSGIALVLILLGLVMPRPYLDDDNAVLVEVPRKRKVDEL